MYKAITLLLLLTILRTIAGCCKDKGYNFRWSRLHIDNINVASSDKPSPVLIADSSKIEDYGFRILFDHEVLASNKFSEFSFSSSYAFTCRAHFSNKDSITSIDVITRNNLDISHAGGSSVADLLLARPTYYYYYYPEYQHIDITGNLPFLNESPDAGIDNNGMDFKFKPVQPVKGSHRFIINVLFKSGRTLTDSTDIRLI